VIKKISSNYTFLIQDKKTEQEYTMKIRPNILSPFKCYEEYKLLLTLHSCKYIIPMREGFLWNLENDSLTSGIKWCLVYPYYQNGSLETNIIKFSEQKSITKKEKKEDEYQIIIWGCQLCEGLLFLHQKNIIHSNLKSATVFLDEQNKIIIGDIGLTQEMKKDSNLYVNANLGNQEMKNAFISVKNENIISLGIILLELLTLKIGITKTNWKSYLNEIAPQFSSEWKKIIQELFNTDPLTKWSLHEVESGLKDMIKHLEEEKSVSKSKKRKKQENEESFEAIKKSQLKHQKLLHKI
jgi:serine/threonine protein kinase